MNNNNSKFVFHHRAGYSDSLWQYRNGQLVNTIHIDNTCDAVYWCNRHGMAVRECVLADNGTVYAIWVGDLIEGIPQRICAVPVRNPEIIREVKSEVTA